MINETWNNLSHETLLWAALLLMCFVLWNICLWLAWAFARLAHLAGRRQKKPASKARTSVSVIIVAHNQAEALATSLPVFLNQQYDAAYEVIVVDVHSKDNTKELLESLEAEYPNITHTAVPASARNISLQRLAVTLGMRAAAGEWVILVKAECMPTSDMWLDTFMLEANADVDVVLGCSKIDDVGHWSAKRWQFFLLWQQMLWMPHALRRRPYRADENVVALRRAHFLAQSMFKHSSELMGCVHSLLVNHNTEKGRTALCLHPESVLITPEPPVRNWQQDRVFFMEERRAILQPCLYRLHYFMQVALPRLFGWYALGLVAYAAMSDWRYAIAPAVLWLSERIGRFMAYRSTARRLDIESAGVAFFLLEWLIPYWDVSAWLIWRCTDKKTFRKKFV